MLFYLSLTCILIYLGKLIYDYQTFIKSSYHQITHNSFFGTRNDVGKFGEYQTYLKLRAFEKDGARFLFNCYLPKEDNETTEIDVIMIYKNGIYVFESKNYSGWIFGDENSKMWTQSLPQGRKTIKNRFLNPIFQNNLHIKYLNEYLDGKHNIHSIIVFSIRCTLKKINLLSQDLYVIKRDQLKALVESIDAKVLPCISQNEINDIYDKLYPLTQVDSHLRDKHIANINTHHENLTTYQTSNNNNKITNITSNDVVVCPKCGGTLILKTVKKGKNIGLNFYGCSNFPKCRNRISISETSIIN